MSFYATLEGHVQCPDKATFDELFFRLYEGGWIRQDQFQNENEDDDGHKHVDHETFEFWIPQAYYRNLTHVNFFVNPATKGYIRGSSTDGCEICWVDGPEDIRIPEMPLNLWGDEDDEPAEDDEDRLNWLAEAEVNFHGSSYDCVAATYREYIASQPPDSGQTDDTN